MPRQQDVSVPLADALSLVSRCVSCMSGMVRNICQIAAKSPKGVYTIVYFNRAVSRRQAKLVYGIGLVFSLAGLTGSGHSSVNNYLKYI